MTKIPIYDFDGSFVRYLEINDDVDFKDGRVQKGKKSYYKGIGVPHKFHFLDELKEGYDLIQKTNVFYSNYKVTKKEYQNKFGIFNEPYQPFFSDFIGACGVKEGLIVLNSETFAKSSVEVLDYHVFDEENNQSYYSLNYKCNRSHYLDDGDPKKLRELLDFMIQTDWNFLWDKGSISDVSKEGLVSDVADLFVSKDLSHKLGTVYSILYSLAKTNEKKYFEFLKLNNYSHQDERSYVFNAIKILHENNIDCSPLIVDSNLLNNYFHILKNFLLVGKNCAYCACNLYKDNGDAVRDKYLAMI